MRVEVRRRRISERDQRCYDVVEHDRPGAPPRLVQCFRDEDWPDRDACRAAAEACRARYLAIDDLEPVGLAEIAGRLDVERATVDKWRTRGTLPTPRWTVGGRPAWAWGDIEAWARETGRLT